MSPVIITVIIVIIVLNSASQLLAPLYKSSLVVHIEETKTGRLIATNELARRETITMFAGAALLAL